jgi:hypothetical protein
MDPEEERQRECFGTLVSEGVEPHACDRPVAWTGTLLAGLGDWTIPVEACERHSMRLVDRRRLEPSHLEPKDDETPNPATA